MFNADHTFDRNRLLWSKPPVIKVSPPAPSIPPDGLPDSAGDIATGRIIIIEDRVVIYIPDDPFIYGPGHFAGIVSILRRDGIDDLICQSDDFRIIGGNIRIAFKKFMYGFRAVIGVGRDHGIGRNPGRHGLVIQFQKSILNSQIIQRIIAFNQLKINGDCFSEDDIYITGGAGFISNLASQHDIAGRSRRYILEPGFPRAQEEAIDLRQRRVLLRAKFQIIGKIKLKGPGPVMFSKINDYLSDMD
jgi:hypothetical protein